MRIVYIAAGAGGSYCGACARDAALARGLRSRGCDVLMLPVYTPIRVDGPNPAAGRVFCGGINAYLQQRWALFRRTPRWFDRMLDRPALLRRVARFAVETQPEKLGPLTVSMLRGEQGRQRKALQDLFDFLAQAPPPDVVNLTNSLLSGLAEPIRKRTGAAMVCSLQGEDAFVRRLPSPHRETAQALLRERAARIDLFVAPGESYAEEMAEFLAVPRDRIRVVRPGVDAAAYARRSDPPAEPFRIVCLSRVTPAKGQDLLAEAFVRLRHRERCALTLAGELAPRNRAFLRGVRARLQAAGLENRFEYLGEADAESKRRLLQQCHVFALASRFPEARGMAVLEAMAAGAAVVAPNAGIFPEARALTNGLVLVPPGDPDALAAAIDELAADPSRARSLGRTAAEGVARWFSVESMVEATLALYRSLLP